MTWDLHLGPTTAHVPLWPGLVGAAGVVAAVVAAALIRQTIRGAAAPDRAEVRAARGWGWIALAPFAVALVAPRVHVAGLLSGAEDHAAAVFRGPVLVDLVLATLGAAILGRALGWVAALRPEARGRERARRLVQAAGVGALLAQAALLQAGALLTLDEPLPTLALPEPAIVHVGRSASLTPRLVKVGAAGRKSPRSFDGWEPTPLVVTGDPAGPREVTLRAQHRKLPWLTLTARASIQIAEERGDGRFPLRVGNRWRYEVTRSTGLGGIVGVLGASGGRSSHALQIRVVGTEAIAGGGLRAFRLAIAEDQRAEVEVQVYAADGQLFFFDGEGASQPLLTARDDVEIHGEPRAQLGFGLAFGASCTCGVVGPLRGPAVCIQEISVNAGVQIGVGILTAGIVAPGDTTVVWTLRETEAGPADAPAALSSAAVARCEGPPRIGIAPGDDTPPEARATFQESLAAMPDWVGESDAVPQVSWEEEVALFKAGVADRRAARDVEELVCKVTYSGNPDNWVHVEPDLDITLKVGGIGPVFLRNMDDTHEALLSAGPLKLRGGESVSAHFVDRNSFGSAEDLGVVAGSLRGDLPLRVKSGDRSIECAGLLRAEVEASLARGLANADKELTALAEHLSPRKDLEVLGIEEAFGPARRAIEGAAALVGWADPRVARRLAWEGRLEESFASKAIPIVRELSQLAIDEVVHGDAPVALRAVGLACGDDVQKAYAKADRAWGHGALKRWGCVLRVAIENRGESPYRMHLSWAPLSPAEKLVLALGSGKAMRLRPIEVEGAQRESGADAVRSLRGGARGVVIFAPLGAIPPAPERGSGAVVLVGRERTVLSVP